MRSVGVDLGERRIGIAVSDSAGVLATPHSIIDRSGDAERDRRAISAVVRDVGAGEVVVGLPLLLSGARGRAVELAVAEARALADELDVPVVLQDERLSTVEAERRRRSAAAGGEAPSGRGRTRGPTRRPRPRRQPIDDVAAAVLLQAWLDGAAARRVGGDDGSSP